MATTLTLTREAVSYDGRRMTLAEFEALDLDEIKPYLEWWDGVVVQKPVPNRKHVDTQAEFTTEFRLHQRVHGGFSGPEGHVWFEGRGYKVPDVAYWAPGRDQGDDQRLLPPTLAVEVCSRRRDMPKQRTKCRERRDAGVDVCWLADPDTRTIEVFDEANDGTVLGAAANLSSRHLPGFALGVAAVFPVR